MKGISQQISKFAFLMALVVLGVLPIVAGSSSFLQQGDKALAQPVPTYLTYDNSQHGVSIDYPNDWHFEEYDGNYFVIFYSPFDDESDQFSENVGIFVETVAKTDSLDSYVDQYLNEISDVFPESEIVEDRSSTLSGEQARLVLTADTDFDEDGELDHRTLRAFLFNDGRAYVIIYDAVQGKYDSYLSVVSDMLQSLTIETSDLAPAAFGEQFLTYQNSTYGVKINHPDNWDVVIPPGESSAIAYFYPPYENDFDVVADFALVAYEDLPAGTSLSEYTTSTIALLSSDDESFNLIASEESLVAGHLGHQLTYTFDSLEYGSMKSTLAWFIAGNRAFIVGITSEEVMYDKYISGYQKMLESFQITNTSTQDNPVSPYKIGDLVSYDNPSQAFSISYPDNWIKTEPEQKETLFTGEIVTFVSPTNDAFVTVSIESMLLKPMTAQEYTDITIQSLRNGVSLLKIEESTQAVFGGQPGHRLEYSGLYTFLGDTAVNVKAIHVWSVLKDSRAYVLTYVALPESFDVYLPAAEKMIASTEIDAAEVPERISGTLNSEEMGFSIELPEGWAGGEGNSALKEQMPFDSFIMVLPELERVTQSAENMTLDEMDSSQFANDLLRSFLIIASINIEDLIDGKFAQRNATSDNGDSNCVRSDSATVVNIGGVKGLQVTGECSYSSLDNKYHYTAYAIMNSKNAVLLALFETPESKGQLEKFESAIQTISVQAPVDLSDPWSVSSLIKEKREIVHQTVYVDESPYKLQMVSNSTISDFTLETDRKQISFKAEGESNTMGAIELELGQVLKGPYTVLVDGAVIENTLTINDSTTGRSILSFAYPHSIHEIIITGTNVVPELENFALLAAVIGLIITIAGLKASRRPLPGYPRK